jgi:outer membrane protein assembly factor BamB
MTTSSERLFESIRTTLLVPCLCFTLLWAGRVFATDWPQWRGPNRAALWTESGLVDKLPNAGLKVIWRAPVAMGYSSPVIAAGRVYLSDAELNKPTVRERVHCLEADSGRALWTYSYETPAPDWFFTEGQGRGPGATPIVWKGKIYALDLFGNLVCLSTNDGHVVWKKNLKEEYQMKETSVDASPLIEGDLLILMLGGKGGAGIVALDRNTGREVWRALNESPCDQCRRGPAIDCLDSTIGEFA